MQEFPFPLQMLRLMLLFLLLLVAWLGFVNCWRCGYRLRLYGDRYGPCWAWEQKVATAAAAAVVVVCSLQFDKRCTHFECSLTNRRTDWLTDWLALFYRYVLVECSSTGTSDLAQNVLPTREKMWTATLTWTRTVTDGCLQPNWPANQENCPSDCIVGDDYIHCTKRCKSVYLFCVTNGCNPKKSLAVDFYGCIRIKFSTRVFHINEHSSWFEPRSIIFFATFSGISGSNLFEHNTFF